MMSPKLRERNAWSARTSVVSRVPTRRRLLLGLGLLALLFPLSRGQADGLAIGYDYIERRWNLQKEESQLCIISHRSGTQRMLLSVALSDLRNAKAAWIVPVPAQPESTAVELVKGFPHLWGHDIVEQAGEALIFGLATLLGTQIYPLLPLWVLVRDHRGVVGAAGDEDRVKVYHHREKLGLTAEVVSARRPGALIDYLAQRGAELPAQAESALAPYTNDSFSFVVSWISDTGAFMGESLARWREPYKVPALGISVTFPTPRPFFPLRPTSVYGSGPVPMALYVIGYVTPELYPGVAESTRVRYCTQSYFRSDPEFREFFGNHPAFWNLEYTRLDMNPESHLLKKDLWFRPAPPRRVVVSRLLGQNTAVWAVWMLLVLLLSSCLASLAAGAVGLRRFRLRPMRMALFGLWNCLTLFGLALATSFWTFRQPGSPGVLTPEILPRAAGPSRKLAYILLFTLFFDLVLFLFFLGTAWLSVS